MPVATPRAMFCILSITCLLTRKALRLIINPRRACAERVTVVVLCVCVCLAVCLSEHAILAVRAIRSITKDTIVLSVRFAAILKRRFSLNCLIRKLELLLLTSAGAAIFSLVPTPRAMFCILSVTCLLTRKALCLIIISD